MIEEVYSRTWFLGKRGGFKKYKGDSNCCGNHLSQKTNDLTNE